MALAPTPLFVALRAYLAQVSEGVMKQLSAFVIHVWRFLITVAKAVVIRGGGFVLIMALFFGLTVGVGRIATYYFPIPCDGRGPWVWAIPYGAASLLLGIVIYFIGCALKRAWDDTSFF